MRRTEAGEARGQRRLRFTAPAEEQAWNERRLSRPVRAPLIAAWSYRVPAVVLGCAQRPDAAMNATEPEIQASLTDTPDKRPEQFAMRAQMRQLLEARIDLLPEVFRTVFMLRAVEEMSVEEVSEALGIPEATVRTRFFRARGLLREDLASQADIALGDAFAFDGARCDRIVAGVLARGGAEGLSRKP